MSGHKAFDLVGRRFERLTVIERAPNYESPEGVIAAMWICQCDCGNQTVVFGRNLKSGATRSCGCLRKERCGRRKRDFRQW